MQRHHPYVVELIAQEAGVEPTDVVDFELVLYDTQKPCIGGLNDELLLSARLDNLEMSYCSVTALINSVTSQSALDDEASIRLISLFDHEEIGSNTARMYIPESILPLMHGGLISIYVSRAKTFLIPRTCVII